jgi:hypothetical protein
MSQPATSQQGYPQPYMTSQPIHPLASDPWDFILEPNFLIPFHPHPFLAPYPSSTSALLNPLPPSLLADPPPPVTQTTLTHCSTFTKPRGSLTTRN